MMRRSFKQIRLALLASSAPSGTGAAGPCRLAFANDNARLRLFPDFPNRVLRLAGRLALAQLRAIYQSGRTVSRSFSPNSFLVCQRIPRAVTKIASAYFVPPVSGHQCLRAVDFDLTAIGEAVVPQLMGGSRDRAGL